jgi:hypothetical protein
LAIRATYRNGTIEITYLEGGARYVTIWVHKLAGKYQEYAYPKDGWTLLGNVGLERNATADFSNVAVTRWRDLYGITRLTFFLPATKRSGICMF